MQRIAYSHIFVSKPSDKSRAYRNKNMNLQESYDYEDTIKVFLIILKMLYPNRIKSNKSFSLQKMESFSVD